MYRKLPAMEDLEAIISVARAGSISTAARKHMVHQQTMSARIARAEKMLGITIFARSPYGVTLTEQGSVLIDALPDLLGAYHSFAAVVSSLHAEDTPRHLTVAVSNTVAEIYYPTWAAALVKLHPSVRMTMMQANSREVRGLVADSVADVGVIEGGNPRHDLVEEVLGSDELVLTVPTSHVWARRAMATTADPVTADELRATALLVREPGSGSRKVVEEVLGEMAEPAGEFGSLSAQRAAILALGQPAIISRGAVADQVALGRIAIVPTDGIHFNRDLCAVTRRGTDISTDVADFIAAARAHTQY